MALSHSVGEIVDSAEVAEFKKAFSTESKHRNFKLQCKDDVIFVNGGFLSELSEFFDAAYFGSFSEAGTKSISLPEEDITNVLEFLAIIYGRKSVDVKNCAEMLRYADLWNVPSLQLKCKEYLGEGFLLSNPSLADAVNILESALLTGCKNEVENVVSRVAAATFEELDQHRVLKRIVDPPVVAAIYSSLRLQAGVVKHQEHNYECSDYILLDGVGAEPRGFGFVDPHAQWMIPGAYQNKLKYDFFARCKKLNTVKGGRNHLQTKCNFSNCDALIVSRCYLCGLKFCEKHKNAVDCSMSGNENGKKPVFLKVAPYQKNHVPVNTKILFQE